MDDLVYTKWKETHVFAGEKNNKKLHQIVFGRSAKKLS